MSNSYDKSDLSFFARERADGRYGFWWITSDTDLWADTKTDLKRSFNHAAGLRYDPDEREWTIPRSSVPRLQRWADAWSSRQQWDALPRSGARRHSERPYERAQGAQGATVDQAYATLHLLPSAPPEVVQAAHRALVKTCHPDVGGSHHAMVSLNAAVDTIREVQAVQARAS